MTYLSPLDSLNAISAIAPDALPSASSQPIGIILSSSGEDRALPGETLEISVTVSNKGNQSAVIDIFLDELPTAIHDWCQITQTRLALDPGQGEEVTFSFEVPLSAMSGAYRYWLIVDSPIHYPDSPPQRYEQTLQVLPPTHTAIKVNDPTYAVEPATTPAKPVKTLPGHPLQFQVHVYNRADRVDRFRLDCKDLPEDWVSVHYPQGFQTPGLAIIEPHLDLNPGANGMILLTVTPPIETLAGTVLATLQVKSENNPALKLLDILYLTVQPVYQLQTRFRTLVSRIQQQPALFSLQASNHGNTPRTLALSILGLQDSNQCDYAIEPPVLALAPQQTLTSQIAVQPKHPWKRPLFGGGRAINFEVVATDPEQKPLPEIPMPGLLMWEARPWWQILPVVLLLFGSLAGLVLLVWWFLIRPPVPASILKFSPENTAYEASRGDAIHLGFEIKHPERVRQIEIVGLSAEGELLSGPLTFDISQGLPPALAGACLQQRRLLTCRNVRTDARKVGDYTFTLSLIPKPGRNAASAQAIALPVSILPVQPPRIVQLTPTIADYIEAPPVSLSAEDASASPPASVPTSVPTSVPLGTPASPPSTVRLNWTIDHPEQLQKLALVSRDEQGNAIAPATVFDVQSGWPESLAEFCTLGRQLVCNNVLTAARQAGTYTFELTAIPQGQSPEAPIVSTSEPVTVSARSPRLISLTLNGEPAQPNYLISIDQGQPPISLNLAWEVENTPGTQVVLSPAPGTVPAKGAIALPLSPQPGQTLLSLQVTNATGEQIARSISITTYDPTPESPTIVIDQGDEATESGGAAAGSSGDGGRPIGPSRPGTVSPRELPPQFE